MRVGAIPERYHGIGWLLNSQVWRRRSAARPRPQASCRAAQATTAAPWPTAAGADAGDSLGSSVSDAGDVNNDGYDDVLVGANYHTSGSMPSAGAVYIHHGSPSGVPLSATTGFGMFYADMDADGFGDAAAAFNACDLPSAHSSDSTDCDDASATVNPAATDVPDDTVDQDCDGVDATSGGPSGSHGGTNGGGCSTVPAAPMPWLLAVLALPAVDLRRRRA